MKVTDVHEIVNELYSQMTGKKDVAEISSVDLVDIGKELKNITSVDNLYNAIVDKVGRFVVKNKIYNGKFPNLIRSSWEFGSIMESLRVKPFAAVEDPSANPTAGDYSLTSYAPADVVAKYFTDYDNFQFIYWKPTDQLWSAFNSYEEMERFLGAIEVEVANSLTVRLQGLAKTAIGTMIAQTVYKDFGASDAYGDSTTSRCINVLKLYNDLNGTSLTSTTCRQDANFLKFLVKTIINTRDRLQEMSSIFNIDGVDTFTGENDINLTLLSTVANDIAVNMQSDVFNKELVSLPNYDVVSYWQSSGESFDEETIGEIMQSIKVIVEDTETSASIDFKGILAVMYDKMAVGVNCEKKKTTAFYHPNLDQTKFFDKYFAQYYVDTSDNFVVFYVADPETESEPAEPGT